METYILDTSNYLQHHGVIGQKWGIRRYQNKDGSLTARGKKHQEAGNKKAAKKAAEFQMDAERNRTKSHIAEMKEKNFKANTLRKRAEYQENISKQLRQNVSPEAYKKAYNSVARHRAVAHTVRALTVIPERVGIGVGLGALAIISGSTAGAAGVAVGGLIAAGGAFGGTVSGISNAGKNLKEASRAATSIRGRATV